MNDTTFLQVMKPWLAQGARDALRVTGVYLLSHHFIQGGNAGVDAFVGAGMTFAGFAWGWFTTFGMVKLSTFLKKMKSPQSVTGAVVKVLLAAFALSLLFPVASRASDISGAAAINKALASGYPTTKCGMYYGVGTGGNAGSVNGANVGTQIVQGDIDAVVGYTCPFAASAFWFAEAQGGISNLNGSTNGLALSGPAVFIERFGAGSPINSLLGSLFPTSNMPALPSIPLLPAGITQSPGNSYGFAGIVEQDIGAQIGSLSGHQWVVAPILGLGLLTRLSNNVMVDTWAGWQMNSNSFCPGGGSKCAQLGNMARIGVAFKY